MIHSFRQSGLSIQKYAGQVGIPYSTLGKWKIQVENLETSKMNNIYQKKGRPPLIDEDSLKSVTKAVSLAKKSQKSIRNSNLVSILKKEIEVTTARRNIVIADPNIDRTTTVRYRNNLGIGKKVGQLKTTARVKAEEDPRNALSMIAMATVFCEGKTSKMILNYDATQFITSMDKDKTIICVNHGLIFVH